LWRWKQCQVGINGDLLGGRMEPDWWGKLGVKVEFDAAKAENGKEVADVDGDGKLTLHDGTVALKKPKKQAKNSSIIHSIKHSILSSR